MYGHDPSSGMKHSEDALRRAREAGSNPGASRPDHRGRLELARRVLGAIGIFVILWILWTNLLA